MPIKINLNLSPCSILSTPKIPILIGEIKFLTTTFNRLLNLMTTLPTRNNLLLLLPSKWQTTLIRSTKNLRCPSTAVPATKISSRKSKCFSPNTSHTVSRYPSPPGWNSTIIPHTKTSSKATKWRVQQEDQGRDAFWTVPTFLRQISWTAILTCTTTRRQTNLVEVIIIKI